MRFSWAEPVLLVAAIVISGCPTNAEKKAGGLPPCTEFGQRCEISPGKAGSCVIRENCTGKDCLVCQSQH